VRRATHNENEVVIMALRLIIDMLSYNTKNDKAFASAGNVTNKYMACPRLIKPIIKKTEIKDIILGGGQNLLSPERRFDAILFNSPGLFS
jgi:HindVP restriction endonuclease